MKKLLIIDDEASLLKILALKFKKTGTYDVETASDGKDGLAKNKSFEPDVILTDIMMPEMDGQEMIESIRKTNQEVKIIAYSALDNADVSLLVEQYNISGIACKSDKFDDLKHQIDVAAGLADAMN